MLQTYWGRRIVVRCSFQPLTCGWSSIAQCNFMAVETVPELQNVSTYHMYPATVHMFRHSWFFKFFLVVSLIFLINYFEYFRDTHVYSCCLFDYVFQRQLCCISSSSLLGGNLWFSLAVKVALSRLVWTLNSFFFSCLLCAIENFIVACSTLGAASLWDEFI